MLDPNTQKAFMAFYRSARNNEVLDPKTTLLIHTAVSMAVGCQP